MNGRHDRNGARGEADREGAAEGVLGGDGERAVLEAVVRLGRVVLAERDRAGSRSAAGDDGPAAGRCVGREDGRSRTHGEERGEQRGRDGYAERLLEFVQSRNLSHAFVWSVSARGASGSDRPVCSFRCPIRLSLPLLPSGNPERQGAPCAPCSYGDMVCPGDGGGVRCGLSVGVGVGEGEGVGSAVALGDGTGVAVGAGVAVGEGVGVGAADSVGEAVGAGVAVGDGVGAGVAMGAVVTLGVAVTGAAVDGRVVADAASCVAGADKVGVATGLRVAPRPAVTGSLLINSDAARTSAPPRRVTTRIVATKVPVVRTAPRRICVRRSASQEWWSRRRARASMAAARIRSSRSRDGGGVAGRLASSERMRAAAASSARQAAHPLTCALNHAKSAGRSSSSVNESVSCRARSHAGLRPKVVLVTLLT